ncbi:MAG: lipopolysaccharide heptosyltransferase II [Gammaproteobacteria bacterium]|nr:lipopolysaccharide heptosyltransferase II [Gammaproteobacteria bacterium]
MMDRVLVVGPSWVGDMVMAQTLFKSLLSTRPGVTIDVMAPAAALAVTKRMPEVSRSILFEMSHGELRPLYRRRFARSLDDYEQAIVLPNSAKSALVPFFAGIGKRTGFLGEMRYFLLNDIRSLDEQRLPRMIDRFVALGDEQDPANIAYPELKLDSRNQEECLKRLDLDQERPVMGICPGAEFGDAKKWPEEHYASLANYGIENGLQVWIFGSPRDDVAAERICDGIEKTEYCHNLAGKTTLVDVVDLMAISRLVVSNDSGLMHIASAMGCETVVLYGSTSPVFTPPLTQKVEIFSRELSCSPCFERTCPLDHKECLTRLQPQRLHRVVDKVLDNIL